MKWTLQIISEYSESVYLWFGDLFKSQIFVTFNFLSKICPDLLFDSISWTCVSLFILPYSAGIKPFRPNPKNIFSQFVLVLLHTNIKYIHDISSENTWVFVSVQRMWVEEAVQIWENNMKNSETWNIYLKSCKSVSGLEGVPLKYVSRGDKVRVHLTSVHPSWLHCVYMLNAKLNLNSFFNRNTELTVLGYVHY
jgi:hypothetical protein